MEEVRDPALTEGIPTYRAWHRLLPIPSVSYPAYVWAAVQAVRAIERQGFRPDIVHAHVYSSGLPAAAVARWRHIPMVLTEHTSAFPRRLLSPQQARVARLALSLARVVMPVSLALQRGIEEYGIRTTFQVVPNAVDTRIFHPDPAPLASMAKSGIGDQDSPACDGDCSSPGTVPVKGIPHLLAALAILERDPSRLAARSRRRWPQSRRIHRPGSPTRLGRSRHLSRAQPKAEVAAFMRQADLSCPAYRRTHHV